MISRIVIILASAFCMPIYASEARLSELVKMGYDQNPLIKSYEQQVSSFEDSATAMSTLSSPSVGVSELDRGMKTQYWTISQKIEFPTKYGL